MSPSTSPHHSWLFIFARAQMHDQKAATATWLCAQCDFHVDKLESACSSSSRLLIFTNAPCLTVVLEVWTLFWNIGKSSVGVKAAQTKQPVRHIWDITMDWPDKWKPICNASKQICLMHYNKIKCHANYRMCNMRMCCNGISVETKCLWVG